MGKKAKKASKETKPEVEIKVEEPEPTDDDTLVGDKTRCGKCQGFTWFFFLFVLILVSFACFVTPQRFYESKDENMPRTRCHASGCDLMLPYNTFWSDQPGWDFGSHYKSMYNNFNFAHMCKYMWWQEAPLKTDTHQNQCGFLTMRIIILWFSTLCAVPYFFVFSFFPGWAYKIHFVGRGKCNQPFKRCTRGKITCSIPVSTPCGKVASAEPEQKHQADQMSRLLGLYIAAAFGGPLFFSRFGLRNECLDDALMANMCIWALMAIFHISSIVNGAAPRCYSIYQLIWCLVLVVAIFLTYPTSERFLSFSLEKEWNKVFVPTRIAE